MGASPEESPRQDGATGAVMGRWGPGIASGHKGGQLNCIKTKETQETGFDVIRENIHRGIILTKFKRENTFQI